MKLLKVCCDCNICIYAKINISHIVLNFFTDCNQYSSKLNGCHPVVWQYKKYVYFRPDTTISIVNRYKVLNHVWLHVSAIWDPILCAHFGTCYVLKLAWWWLHEQPKHVATRDLTSYLLTIEIVVSGRKYTYVLYCHTTGWHPLRRLVDCTKYL